VNPVERLLRKADGAQQKYQPSAFVFGVVKKYGDDNGGVLVANLTHSDSVYGVFATVLGLVAWLYLAAEITVYCAEVNVVLARRLWPRSIIQPPSTEADRASLALQALQNQRREEQQVTVTFDDRGRGVPAASTTPQTPDEVSPPAPRTPEPRRTPTEGDLARDCCPAYRVLRRLGLGVRCGGRSPRRARRGGRRSQCPCRPS